MTGRIGLAVAPSNPQRVYALIESKAGILWRSDDAGATWKLMSKDTLVNQRPFYFSHVRVDPSNADHVYGVSEALSESKDGGKTFKEIASQVHVDYHDMWIAPNDPARMIVGEDGGYAITTDGGAAWSFSRNLAIGQIYHVGYDDRTPYSLCVGLQDNNGFCGPSNSLNGEGIIDESWDRVIGGDGMWAWPDPRDPNLVWTDLQTGRVSIYDRRTQRSTFVQPWRGTAQDDFALDKARYRYNWDAPIAFDAVRSGDDVLRRERRVRDARPRPALDGDLARSHPQRQVAPAAVGRAARARRVQRGVHRHAARHRVVERRRAGRSGPAATTASCSSAVTAASAGAT